MTSCMGCSFPFLGSQAFVNVQVLPVFAWIVSHFLISTLEALSSRPHGSEILLLLMGGVPNSDFTPRMPLVQ